MLSVWHALIDRYGKDMVLVILIIFAIIFCFADVIFLPYTFYYQDIQFLHYPGKIHFMDSLREGNYGFWSPHVFCGYPLQAEPEVGPLYPFNLLFALSIPAYYAQTLFVVLHYILGGIFTFLLARSFQIKPTGSLIAAFVYSCSGYMMAQLTNFSILTASIWLPLILLLFSIALNRRSYRYAVATGIIIALFILTAHPQFILLTLTVLGLFYLYNMFCLLVWDKEGNKTKLAWTYSLFILIAVATGSALSAPQLLPAYELKSLSVLSESLGFDFVTSYSLSPYRMASFLFPNFLGNQATGYRGPAFFEEHHNYIGLLPLVLVGFSFFRRREKKVLFFILLLILSIILSWGRLVPIYHLIAELPLFNLFRVPARWLYPMTIALALLAGFGFDYLLASKQTVGMKRFARALLILAGVLTLTLPWVFVLKSQIMDVTGWFVENVYPSYAIFTLRSLIKAFVRFPDLPPANFLLHLFPFLINPLFHFLVLLDISALIFYLFVTDRLSSRLFKLTAVVVIVFDLFLVSGSAINPVEPASYFDRSESTAFLQENVGLDRIYPTNQDGNPNFHLGHYFPMIYDIPSFGGSSSLTIRWAQEYRNAATVNPRLYDLAGVKYVLDESEVSPEGFSAPLRKVFSIPEINIWENSEVMPRTFIVHEAALENSEEEGTLLLEDSEFPFEKKVLLNDPAALSLVGGTENGLAGDEFAEIVDYSYNSVIVECQIDTPGFLILTDSYYPGWEATVDGQAVTIYRANHIFRAVFLTPGHHIVEFHFAQPLFWLGVGLAGVTVLIILALWSISSLKKKRGYVSSPKGF